MIREEVLNAQLIITFIFISFACIFDLPDCTFTLMLMTVTAIMTDLLMMVMLLLLLLSLLNVQSFARIMMKIVVLT